MHTLPQHDTKTEEGAAIAALIDLTERFGMPAPISERFERQIGLRRGAFVPPRCGCPADVAMTGTCCEQGRRRPGIPVPPMEAFSGIHIPHNRD